MAEAVLAFQGITHSAGEGPGLLQGFDWSLEPGARVRLPAGAETSALVRLAAGADHPAEGRVLLGGHPLGPHAFDHPFLRAGSLGWVSREGGLLVNQTLLANLMLPQVFVRLAGRQEAEAAAREALAGAGLGEAAERRPHLLDPRERWLGALLRAALLEPRLWLVEAPPAALTRSMKAAAAALLERSSSAAFLFAGDENWPPWDSAQTLRWDGGHLVPGDT